MKNFSVYNVTCNTWVKLILAVLVIQRKHWAKTWNKSISHIFIWLREQKDQRLRDTSGYRILKGTSVARMKRVQQEDGSRCRWEDDVGSCDHLSTLTFTLSVTGTMGKRWTEEWQTNLFALPSQHISIRSICKVTFMCQGAPCAFNPL